MKKIVSTGLMIIICLCMFACSNTNSTNSKYPKEYVGTYDGEFGGYLELKPNGNGTYKDKGAKSGRLTWFVDNYKLSVSADTLDHEIYADIHSFNNMLYFVSNNRSWIAERFNKRK